MSLTFFLDRANPKSLGTLKKIQDVLHNLAKWKGYAMRLKYLISILQAACIVTVRMMESILYKSNIQIYYKYMHTSTVYVWEYIYIYTHDCRSKGPCRDCPLQRPPGFQHETAKVFPEFAKVFFGRKIWRHILTWDPRERQTWGSRKIRERIFFIREELPFADKGV